MLTGCPTMVLARRAVRHIDGDALAQADALEIGLVGAVGAFRPGAGVGIVVEHPRHPLLGEHAQVFDAGDGSSHGIVYSPSRTIRGLVPRCAHRIRRAPQRHGRDQRVRTHFAGPKAAFKALSVIAEIVHHDAAACAAGGATP